MTRLIWTIILLKISLNVLHAAVVIFHVTGLQLVFTKKNIAHSLQEPAEAVIVHINTEMLHIKNRNASSLLEYFLNTSITKHLLQNQPQP